MFEIIHELIFLQYCSFLHFSVMYKNNKKINKGFSIRDVNSELGLLDEDLSGVSVGVWK